MKTRKEMKKKAKQSLKKHYAIFIAICLIAGFLGTEYSSSLSGTKVYSQDQSSQSGKESDLSKVSRLSGSLGIVKVFESVTAGNDGKFKPDPKIFGTTRGVLAGAVNSLTSGSILVTASAAINSVVKSKDLTLMLMILISLLLNVLFWIFVVNVFEVVSRRIFLEGRTYEKVPLHRIAFLHRVRKWGHASLVLFQRSMYNFFWYFTIAGGIIKRYSYFLVPYIVAENPGISAKEAITLSRKMMHGHKWECFVNQVTFIGWSILGVFTFGLTAILFSNPYQVAFNTEYYAQLRKIAKENGIEGTEYLNDRYLFEAAEDAVMMEAYADYYVLVAEQDAYVEPLRGIRGFLSNFFGITIFPGEKEKALEKREIHKLRIEELENEVSGRTYPRRLSEIMEPRRKKDLEHVQYLRKYSIWSLFLIFIAFSMVGWIWEVSLHLIADGVFVKRGVLHGPWLPIYGTGSILMLTVLNKLRRHPVIEFFSIMILCGTVEYSTSYFLEKVHDGTKWWDYSGYFLNLNGRICAEGLLVFGMGGWAIVYVLAPMADNLIQKIKLQILIPVCLVLFCLYTTDQVYSSKHPNMGKGITNYSSTHQVTVTKKVVQKA